MEGYGLFKECSTIPNLVPCLIVKSICDWRAMKNFDPKPIKGKVQAYKTMDILPKSDVCVLD